jgi:hypothetical protein
LSDFHYIQSSDVRNMNMSLLDQRKTEKMLESCGAMHQDALRGDEQQPEALPTKGTPEHPPLPADGERESGGAGYTFFAKIPWLDGAIKALVLAEPVGERPLRAPEQQITSATAANGTHGTLEHARDDLELPEPAFPFEEDLGASHPHGDKFSC